MLQALARLYERRSRDADPARRLPAYGLEDKDIPFVIELNTDGTVVQLRDTRRLDGKKLRAESFLVPQGTKRAVNIAANLLWDTVEYTLGVSGRGNPERVALQHLAYRARIAALSPAAQEDAGLRAVKAFLHMDGEGRPDLAPLQSSPVWAEVLESNAVLSFRLVGDAGLVCQRDVVYRAALASANADDEAASTGLCLVDGAEAPIQRLHGSIRGVWGAQSSGASIVSFNLDAFASYGKTQGANAPVGQRAAFAYTTALNALLDRDSRNRVQVGDSSTVFWADSDEGQTSRFDSEFTLADLFGEPRADNPDRGRDAVKALYEAVRGGKLTVSEGKTRFYVLGLAPNAARLSVRFWLPGVPFAELAPRILRHFDDLKIAPRYDSDPLTPSLFRLLSSLALQGKLDNVPPRLAGEWMRAILEGSPYPAVLLNAAVTRCKAEREVSYLRAAVLKAWLNRDWRRQHPQAQPDHAHHKETLDMEQADSAYRLGRLFATLERIQEFAQPGINATIRDRYYGAASTTPVAVFPTLLRLKNAHLKKLHEGQVVNFEKLIGEILAPLTDFPRHLALPDQGRFALGYYQQRQAFYTRKSEAATEASNDIPPKEA
ncbi:MAG TPA: type I-C CRISPR-associated protein Cas8c/Csd1 [Methylibium sp.]|uniref:type I-C CRISPR-associated protein Cas8c/Csd1 n=1 Tax=Methylibium sp. TaxID=2067992 RepID=UPI002DB8B6CA|nr:type I-C CRISPR-associated protein Cas8c/Csd1 [Methylibium sp.]HEU4458748.1 type I-C CRISPR-associated protein Cas8c/Csd1 [Methylibium sp.]